MFTYPNYYPSRTLYENFRKIGDRKKFHADRAYGLRVVTKLEGDIPRYNKELKNYNQHKIMNKYSENKRKAEAEIREVFPEVAKL